MGGPAATGRKLHVLSDYDVVRFLRARKGDVAQAAEALKKALAWRESSGADEVRLVVLHGFVWIAAAG